MPQPRKPPGQRVRRNKDVTETLSVPGRMPALPAWASDSVWVEQWWSEAWSWPVSAKWAVCDVPALARLAVLHGQVAAGVLDDSKLLSEIRALEDRFLLNPNSRRLAGVVLEELQPESKPVATATSSARRERLKVV